MPILDKAPQIPGVEGTEPTLRQLVHKYYEHHFPVLAEANQLAMTYLKQIEVFELQASFDALELKPRLTRQSDEERLAWRAAGEWRDRMLAAELQTAAIRKILG